ncbi:MAG: TonB-dependent receptor [Deltaproteobacteria bacterium]|nr:TonB-dependent receptor [Deltaproteobacteria bacterium]
MRKAPRVRASAALASVGLLLLPTVARGQEAPAASPASPASPPPSRRDPAVWVAPRVDVVGEAPRALDRTPGSATVIRREDLVQLAPQSGGDVLRTVPGLNVLGEDPMGLRLNISIRGLDPNRSRKVLVLEDGMPVSLNPYGSPELYYTPPIERMERVEVVRGSGQILWGPQTIGGVINYITRDPPRRPTVGVDLRYGTYGYLLAQAFAGATHGPIGWRLDVIHRRFDGPRNLDLTLMDVAGRLRLQLSPRSIVQLKVNYYDESSAATYLGVTGPQFALDPTINNAGNDRFLIRRYALALTHQLIVSPSVLVRTNVYAYQTNRAWRRQEYDRADTGAEYERACDPMGRCGAPGDAGVTPTNDGGSIFFRRTAATNDRSFDVFGIEPRLTWNWARGAVSGELTALARFHYESADDQRFISSFPTGRSGTPIADEIRNGYALAAAVQHRFGFGERLHVTPGVRFEGFWSDRRVTRAAVVDAMGQTTFRDVDIFGSSSTAALIPGLGLSYRASTPVTLFAGVHRGYAPPRTKDAVSPAGANLQLDPELSWNTELGLRARLGRWLNAEVAGFHIEFENQIIPPSESGGAVSAGGFNTGHSRHMGVESSVTFDLEALLHRRASTFSLPLTINYTWLPVAAFVGGLFDANRVPYAPEHILYAQLRFVHRMGLSAQVSVSYVASQFADRENTVAQSVDGVVGRLPGYVTIDARVGYTVRAAGVTVYLAGRNLTDQIYISNRAPQGIQPAGFRQVFAGLEWSWPRF